MSKANYGDLVTSRATELSKALDRNDLNTTKEILSQSFQSMSSREWNRFVQETNKSERDGAGLDLHPVYFLGKGNLVEVTRHGHSMIEPRKCVEVGLPFVRRLD